MNTGRYSVVVFDLDGTLLPGTSVSQYLAEVIGRGDVLAELERRFRDHAISNKEIADATASWFADQRVDAIWAKLEAAPWINGMAATFDALRAAGCGLLLGTVTWHFAALMLQHKYGFAAVSGTMMDIENGRLSGVVSGYFDEYDKARFVRSWCEQNDVAMVEVAAVGDSRSDIPLFRAAGHAIAINATPEARAQASEKIDTADLRDVLPMLLAPCA